MNIKLALSCAKNPAEPKPDTRNIHINLVTRLYVWSVVLEPLLMFTFSESSSTGFTPNISKLLQLSVLSLLIVGCVLGKRSIVIPTLSAPTFRMFKYYFVLVVVSGFIGYISGAYVVPNAYDLSFTSYSSFSATLNSAEVRPFLEYAVLLYYFFYFSVLPKYLLSNRWSLSYFFDIFTKIFFVCIVLGLIDYALGIFGILFLPRHLGEDFVTTGLRFHGIAGEPRDAFVYLILGGALLYLKALFYERKTDFKIFLLILVCLVATESASGIVGLIVLGILYPFFGGAQLSARRIIVAAFGYVAVGLAIMFMVNEIERLRDYVTAAEGLWSILESRDEIPYLMSVQMVNIYPIYDLTVKFRESNFIPILIGSGLGSASAINNYIPGGFSILANPHSQLVRVIYESGVVGLLLYISIFIRPVRYLAKKLHCNIRHIRILSLLVLSASFGHRSSACYIFLGILVALHTYENSFNKTA